LFRLDSHNVYRAEALEQIGWLEHGFGTRLSSSWPDAHDLATLRQVHSDRVLFADRAGCLGEGDAMITDQAGITLAIRTADCLPILIVDTRRRVVAAVHAGWRGTVLQIAAKTVVAMADRFGTSPEDLVVAFGPGIGACCFEVGPEVSVQFAPFFPELGEMNHRVRVDLVETTLRQLGRNGGTLRQIAPSSLCSCCGGELFHSFRRDRDAAGRMISTIRIG
jgi:YfiH family protein